MTRFRKLAIAIVLVTSGLAGCLAGDDGSSEGDGDAQLAFPEDWASRALPYGGDHDHANLDHHRDLSTPNFELVGWDPLVTEYHERTSGGHLCGGVAESEDQRLAFVHSFTSDVALVVADVTDPENPVTLGELVLPNVHVYDLDATADAEWVVLGANPRRDGQDNTPLPVFGDAAARPYYRDACTGETRPVPVADTLLQEPTDQAPFASGLILVDVRDPENPEVADYRPAPVLGPHSIHVSDAGGDDIVLASNVNLAHPGTYFQFYTIQDGLLVHESTYRPTPRQDDPPITNGHIDGWIREHPITGDRLAYLADWEGGFVIVNVNDLKFPEEIGRWDDMPSGAAGTIHGTYPLPELWDGRHYTIIHEETGNRPGGAPTGLAYVMDTTDPANPERVGAWTFPVDVEWAGFLQFSTHYATIVDRTMFLATYHGGVWAVDLSDVTAPRTAGVFIPDNESPAPPGELAGGFVWTPTVLDVEPLSDGHLVLWDAVSGVYVVRYDAGMDVPLVDEWDLP